MRDVVQRLGRGLHDRGVGLRRLHLLLQGRDVAQDVGELVLRKAGLPHFLPEAVQRHDGFLAMVFFHERAPRTASDMSSLHWFWRKQEAHMNSFSFCRLAYSGATNSA